MTWDPAVLGAGLASIAVFALAFHYSGLVMRTRAAIALVTKTLATINEQDLDDEEKERIAQRAALDLFRAFAIITLSAFGVLAAPGLVLWVGDKTGIASMESVLDFLLSWEVIIAASLLLVGALWLLRRR